MFLGIFTAYRPYHNYTFLSQNFTSVLKINERVLARSWNISIVGSQFWKEFQPALMCSKVLKHVVLTFVNKKGAVLKICILLQNTWYNIRLFQNNKSIPQNQRNYFVILCLFLYSLIRSLWKNLYVSKVTVSLPKLISK